jgi:phospholipase/carboxylesterase
MLETAFIPAADRDSRWLMVVLHGLGDSMAGYGWLPKTLDMPQINYLLVNAPDPYYGGYSWFDFPGDALPGIQRSHRMLARLLDAQRDTGFPTAQTLMFGFSQGCLMTVETGLRYPHRFAGLIGISGFVVGLDQLITELSPEAKNQRFLITHGTEDPLLPFDEVKKQILRLKQAGISIQWHEFDKEHTIAGESELNVIRRFISGCLA